MGVVYLGRYVNSIGRSQSSSWPVMVKDSAID
jgi:hypothetical protein